MLPWVTKASRGEVGKGRSTVGARRRVRRKREKVGIAVKKEIPREKNDGKTRENEER